MDYGDESSEMPLLESILCAVLHRQSSANLFALVCSDVFLCDQD